MPASQTGRKATPWNSILTCCRASDFLRLKSLRIGYDLPKSVIGFQNAVKNVKLTFTGRNLFTITPYNGLDPEVASNLTLGKASNTKQYLFGLEVTF